ncbi:site-specific integrase [Shewanella profunda]|uniref:site-specific integrase n=1 Tax=Shewanella profunda TaxID=254793 RepID=UPI00200EA1C5|nr:site-specific integrase [Shewanella profunda]MCL1089973.1 site-specific integrase [Shewanella profunda]
MNRKKEVESVIALGNYGEELSTQVLTLQKIKDTTLQEKLGLSIGHYDGHDLGNYGDDTWLLQHLSGKANIHRSMKNLSFTSQCESLSIQSSTHQHEYSVFEATRDCLWLRFSDGTSVGQLVVELKAWKVFTHWWVNAFNGMAFEEWLQSPAGLDQYVQWMKQDFRHGHEGSQVSKETQLLRLRPIYQLYHYRQVLKVGFDYPPFRGLKGEQIVGKMKNKSQTQVIGEDKWRALIQAAWDCIDSSEHAIQTYIDYWVTKHSDFVSLPTRDGTKPSAATVSNRKSAFLLTKGYESYTELEMDIILFEGAAIILILALTGMRQSELSGLSMDCFQETKTEFLSTNYVSSFLRGMTYKYSCFPEGEHHVWLVPSELKTVIERVNQLNQHRREKNQRLLLSTDGHSDPLVASEAKKASNSLFLLSGINAKHHYSLRLDSCTIVRRVTCFVGHSGVQTAEKITPHRFRRTLARFVALSPLGSVEALREQFGHHTADITQYYMQGGDDEVLNWIAEDQSEFQKSVMDMQVDSSRPKHGGLGESMMDKQYAARDFKTAKNLKALQKKIGTGMAVQLNAHSVSVRPIDKGACSNNCRLNRIQCISCENCVITTAQLPFWEDQLQMMEACEKEGIVQGLDKVRELVHLLKEEARYGQ